jgi:hypothetical protein
MITLPEAIIGLGLAVMRIKGNVITVKNVHFIGTF